MGILNHEMVYGEDVDEYVIESLRDIKWCPVRQCILYLVHWQGFGEEDDTWEPEGNLHGAGHLTPQFAQQRALLLELNAGAGVLPEPEQHQDQEEDDPSDESVDEDEFVIESLKEIKWDPVRQCIQYFVHWQGFGPEDDTWEPEKNLHGADHLTPQFANQRALLLEQNAGVLPEQHPDEEEDDP